MEATTLRIRMETTSNRNFNRRPNRIGLRRLTAAVVSFTISAAACSQLHADIPWPEVVQRLAYENEKLARRPQGHNGEYFVVCTLYYTPKESGFTFERGFGAALFGGVEGRARWLAPRSGYRDNVPRTSENLREQPVEDHGYRRRSAAMADRLLFRRR